MMFRKLVLLSLVALCGNASVAFAQAAQFAGYGVDIGVAHNRVSDHIEDGSTDREIATNFIIHGRYATPLSDKVLLGLGARFNLNNADIHSGADYQDHTRNEAGLAVELGYALNSLTLLYGKVGVETGQFAFQNPSQVFTRSLHGIGYGAGIRYLFKPHWYTQLEVSRKDFNQIVWTCGGAQPCQDDISQTAASIAIGYQF